MIYFDGEISSEASAGNTDRGWKDNIKIDLSGTPGKI
jgi:hypothetical protein